MGAEDDPGGVGTTALMEKDEYPPDPLRGVRKDAFAGRTPSF